MMQTCTILGSRPNADRPLRHALEVRHASFQQPDFIAQLRRHGVALVVADTAGKWPFMEDITSDFIYARLHGDAQLYVSGYTDTALQEWARKIRIWRDGRQSTRHPPDRTSRRRRVPLAAMCSFISTTTLKPVRPTMP